MVPVGSAGMSIAATVLLGPAPVDGPGHNVEITADNPADEEDLDVMLNRDQFGVVHSGLFGELLGRPIEL